MDCNTRTLSLEFPQQFDLIFVDFGVDLNLQLPLKNRGSEARKRRRCVD